MGHHHTKTTTGMRRVPTIKEPRTVRIAAVQIALHVVALHVVRGALLAAADNAAALGNAA